MVYIYQEVYLSFIYSGSYIISICYIIRIGHINLYICYETFDCISFLLSVEKIKNCSLMETNEGSFFFFR